MLDFLHANAKMLSVVAAIIIFGSWLVENTLLKRANELKQAVQQAEQEKLIVESFHHLESKVLEVYQVAASARRYSAEARLREQGNFKDQLERDVEMLERSGVTLKFAAAVARFAARLEHYLGVVAPTPELAARVRAAHSGIADLRSELDASWERYHRQQRDIHGDYINPNTVTPEQARSLGEAIRSYRNEVESSLAPRLSPAANAVFRAHDDLFRHAREQLKVRERRAEWAERIKIALFILGSVIAVLGTYFDARPKM